jgi:predicted Zn-ribbon and HTH transcriptional regulator
MSRPTLEVADLIQAQGARFVDQYRQQLSYQQLKVLRAIAQCRTAALGGHADECSQCGLTAISYNSCRNRHCPKCQAQARQRWLAAREQELLGVSYFHLVFTLPHALIPLCQRNPRVLYDLLFQTSAAAISEVAADPKHLGAQLGFLSILHTWGQNLLPHPHVHCVIPAGGLSLDRSRWVHPKYPFFLPVKVLSRLFRGKFVDRLQRAFRKKKLQFPRANATLAQPKLFRRFLRTLFREDWFVYAKPAFGGAPQVLRYLGRYTHRVAISNHRLLAFDGQRVTFRWKDYAHGNQQRQMTLAATEFLRRFVQHILPRGFVRIRQFGFLANSCRTARLQLARKLLTADTAKPREPCTPAEPLTWSCPRCGGPMRIGLPLSAAELASRCHFFDSS